MEIEVNGLTKHFGTKKVLNNINLKFDTPGIYGLLGRNGAGKSTLLNLINDRINVKKGKVTLNNQPIRNNEKALSRFYLMNGDNLYPSHCRVKTIFKLSREFYGDFDDKLKQKLVKGFKLDVNKKIRQLSTGYLQIVKIIVALCIPVDFVFLDEPVSGLDANNRSFFYSELIQTYIDRPRCFVISTHLISEIDKLVNHIIILNHHQVQIDADVDQVEELSHQVSGPQKAVDEYVKGLNVIGRNHLGNIVSAYVYGDLNNDRSLQDTVSISAVGIQDLFIHLTDGEEDNE